MIKQDTKPTGWVPPFKPEEWLKHNFIPPSLYKRYRTAKERRWGERELHLIPHLCSKQKISIDAGANVGVWTWEMARHSKEVHAFEPNPKSILRLRRNIGNLENATMHGVALSDRDGEATLRIPRSHKGHSNQGATLSTAAISDDRAFTALPVKQKRLDDYDFTNVGFIKIDVEGFEFDVLEGARETIARDHPNLVIEIEEKHTKTPIAGSVRHVIDLGYRCLYFRRGVLTCFSRFDVEAEHKNPLSGEDYVFNFIFLPE